MSCTATEVETLIKLLNPNKATGPDEISNRMLKLVAKEVSIPLSILFNRSFREGSFAMNWTGKNQAFYLCSRKVTNRNHLIIDPFPCAATFPKFRSV